MFFPVSNCTASFITLLFITTLCSLFQDDAEFKKARGAELEYESLKVSCQRRVK